MFRDQRLGGISDDVLLYISSREADKWIFEADLLVDKAHLIMLKEQELISPDDCMKIIEALESIKEEELGEGEDIHEAIEALVISKVGSLGGRMHTGRSRNDEVATCIRLALRAQMLDLMDNLLSMISILIDLAGENTNTIIPGYTHTQHAQPTTLAHHLLAHADAYSRDLGRLEGAYKRVNQSPLGAAAFASTGFNINRQRTCELLGFDGLVENSMDAVSTRDFALEVLSNLSILMVNVSRQAEELILWSTSEFGYATLDDLYSSTSSIMPQKKNPDTAELARAKAGSVIGSLISALAISKALPMSYNRDLQELTPHLWRGVAWTDSTVRIMRGCISSLKFNRELLKERSGAGFSTATELADSLVRSMGIPFRTAHKIVAKLAMLEITPTLKDLDDASLSIAGIKPSGCGFGQKMLDDALDPGANVAARIATGGPSPVETKRMVSDRQIWLSRESSRVSGMRLKVNAALDMLKKDKRVKDCGCRHP
jgi:argininosuccinate lyase